MKESDVQIHCGCDRDTVCPQGKTRYTFERQCVVVVPEDDLFRIVMALPEFKRRYKMSEQQEHDFEKDQPAGQGNDSQAETVDSTSDDRVRNNVMRHEYKILSEDEKVQMISAKDLGLAFHEWVDRQEQIDGRSRELSLAKTKIEEAVFWGVKHVTG